MNLIKSTTTSPKIGILTFHSPDNYGAKLQAYALCSYLLKLGYNVEIINYRPPYFEDEYYWFDTHIKCSNNLYSFIMNTLRWTRRGWIKYKRYHSFRKFEEKHFVLSKKNNYIPSNYDVYIVGSDQVWSREITRGFDSAYFLNFDFNKENKVLASYAASFELSEIDDSYKSYLQQNLSKFDFISVREYTSKLLLESLINKSIHLCIDPTLLLNSDSWTEFAGERRIKEPYLLFYQVRSNKELLQKARRYSKEKGLKFVHLISKFEKGVYTRYSVASPIDFVNYIKYANCVITSSFHGTAFSLIFSTPFVSFVLGDGKDSRVESLLEKVGLKDKILHIYDRITDGVFVSANSSGKLNEEIRKSKNYINDIINYASTDFYHSSNI